MVHGADRARHSLAAAYSTMGLEFRPETVGCVADSVPGVTVDDARSEVLIALGEVLTVEQRVSSRVS